MEKLPDRDGSNESAFVYNGTARTPGVTVRDGNTVLIEGIDYVQTWKDNIHAGSASVIVKGKGNYTGTKSLPFTIQKAVLTEAQLSSPVLEYNGEEQTVTVSGVRAGSVILSIYPSYLEKLKDGRHLLTAKFTDGEVHTEFTVLGSSSKEEEETESSQWIPPLLPGNGNRNQVVNTSDHTHIAGHAWTMILSLITALLA